MRRTLNNTFLFFFLVHVTGFVLKFFRTPYHTIIMAAGAIGILIIGLLYFTKKNSICGVLSLTTFAWSLYLISVVKFLPQVYFLTGAVIMTVIAVLFLIKMKKLVRLQTFAGSLIFLFAIIMAVLPQDERYYLLNIKYNYHIEQDYWAWDKYSWFLNIAGKNEEALKANKNASLIVENTDDEFMKDLILTHKQKLKSDVWKIFK